ncbi:MAG: energy transducer TonB [Candidatus Acidiferrales bacterium]
MLIITPFIGLAAQQGRLVGDDDMKVLSFEDMNYPALGRTARVQGIVVVQVKLDDQGTVVEAMPISGKQVFIADCIANARKWRFRPNAQKAAVIIYNFRLSDGISKSGCDHFMLEPPNFATITTCPVEIQ